MYSCDVCGEEFKTLSRLRLNHEPCPVVRQQRKRDRAIQQVRDERGLEIGDRCRLLNTGEEVEIVDVEPSEADGEEPMVVWIPVDKEDTPEHRRTNRASEVV